MAKIIRLTESELTKMIVDIVKEQSTIKSSSSKEYNMIDTCASMGIKTPGYCDTQAKKPVKSCADLGVKTPGYCYVDTKKPVPNMAPKSGQSIKEQSSQKERDPKRIAFFDGLTKQISSKVVGKKFPFGKLGALDNTNIIIQKYVDRNHAINLSGYPVKELNLYFDVRRVEEDLYKHEKPGTRVWTGTLVISAKFVNGKISPNPLVELFRGNGNDIDFNNRMKPTKPFTWDMVGGVDLWSKASTPPNSTVA